MKTVFQKNRYQSYFSGNPWTPKKTKIVLELRIVLLNSLSLIWDRNYHWLNSSIHQISWHPLIYPSLKRISVLVSLILISWMLIFLEWTKSPSINSINIKTVWSVFWLTPSENPLLLLNSEKKNCLLEKTGNKSLPKAKAFNFSGSIFWMKFSLFKHEFKIPSGKLFDVTCWAESKINLIEFAKENPNFNKFIPYKKPTIKHQGKVSSSVSLSVSNWT